MFCQTLRSVRSMRATEFHDCIVLRVHRSMATYKAIDCGAPYTAAYRQYFEHAGRPISPWHDIPLMYSAGVGNPDSHSSDQAFNMVCEVPRWSNAKMEIATNERLNPIKQDVQNGRLHYAANIFPHHGYIWNYGALPQTWEDPSHKHPDTQANGDNDPIDVCEIGQRVAKRGDVYAVKILGALALIDEGKTDWKLIAIDLRDPLADRLNEISDVDTQLPGLMEATKDWFRQYKVPNGKEENRFGFGGVYKNREYAIDQVLETHEFWKTLVAKSNGNGDAASLETRAVESVHASNRISIDDARQIVSKAPKSAPAAKLDDVVDHWFYIPSHRLHLSSSPRMLGQRRAQTAEKKKKWYKVW